MSIIGKVKSWFRTQEAQTPFAIGSANLSGQRAIDSNLPYLTAYPKMLAALKTEQNLTAFRAITLTGIGQAIISTLVELVCTDMSADTGSAQLDSEVNNILQDLNIDTINRQIMRNMITYGFASAEWVADESMSALEKIIVLDSYYVRYATRADGSGEIETVLQYPRRANPSQFTTGYYGAIPIPAQKMLTMQNRMQSWDDIYGHSIFESTVNSCEALSELMMIDLKVARRFGSPKFVVEIDPANFQTQEEYTAAINQVISELKRAADDESIVGAPMKTSMIGAESARLKLDTSLRMTLSNIISPTNIPASVLGYMTGGESANRQVIILLASVCRNYQRMLAQTFVERLSPIISALYGFPAIRGYRFAPSRLIEAIQEEQAAKLAWENSLEQLRWGLISGETLAQRMLGGAGIIIDQSAFDQQLEKLRTSAQPKAGDNVPRVNDQTRQSDISLSTAPTDLGA